VALRFFVDGAGVGAMQRFAEVIPMASHLDPTISVISFCFTTCSTIQAPSRFYTPFDALLLAIIPDIGVNIVIYEARSRACPRRVL